MKNVIGMTAAFALFATPGSAQEFGYGVQGGMAYDVVGSPTPTTCEPLYQYDDQEVWKHGWLQINPYEHGYHSYRPYNYKHVFAQAAQSSVWGMPSTMPYSQSYYLRYGPLTGINGQQIPIDAGPAPGFNAPNPGAPVPGYGAPTSWYSTSPLRQQPFNMNQSPQQLNQVPGLTHLPGHQFAPPTQKHMGYGQPQQQRISPAGFQQLHDSAANGPEYQRQLLQKTQMQQMLQQGGFVR